LRSTPAGQSNSALQLEIPDEGVNLDAVERELLLRALEKAGGNQTRAARYLDISRKTFIYRMEKHGLRAEDGDQE